MSAFESRSVTSLRPSSVESEPSPHSTCGGVCPAKPRPAPHPSPHTPPTSIFPKCVRGVSFLGWPGHQKRRSGGFAIAGRHRALTHDFSPRAVACLYPDSLWGCRCLLESSDWLSREPTLSRVGTCICKGVPYSCLYLRTDGDSLHRRCMQLHYGSQFLSRKPPLYQAQSGAPSDIG